MEEKKKKKREKKKDPSPHFFPLKINKTNQSKGLSGEEAVLPARHQASGCPDLCPLGCQIKDLGLSFHPRAFSDSSFFSRDVCCCWGRQTG